MFQGTELRVTTCPSSSLPEEQPVRPMTHRLPRCIKGVVGEQDAFPSSQRRGGCEDEVRADGVVRPAETVRRTSIEASPYRARASRHPSSARRGICHVAALGFVFLALTPSLHAQTAWNFVGPAGGAPPRVVRLASDPRSDSVLYFAAPGGGVWNSTNGGGSWLPIADSLPSLEVCSIAIDSRSPDVLYA